MIAEATAFPNLRIVLGCRQFDVDNDHRIRTFIRRVEADAVTVAPLIDAQVNTALTAAPRPGAMVSMP
ncbi:hypothetical protein [Nocardia sp. NPDC004711]